jgi:hypothetical protein
MPLNFWILATILMWLIYSALTIYGAFKFPLYSPFEKIKAFMLVLALPFLGAYLVNYDMGHRLNDESKETLLYELPWWASIGVNTRHADHDDD